MNDIQELVQSAGLEVYRFYLPDIEVNKPHLCPFHDDNKTPNLSLFKDKDGVYRFKCFACNVSGDALDFIEKMQGAGLPAAIEKLKELIGTPANAKIENKSKTPHKDKPARQLTLGQIKKEILPGGYKCKRLHKYRAGKPPYIKALYKNGAGNKQARYWSLIDEDKGIYEERRISKLVIYNQELLEQRPDDVVVVVEGEGDADTLTGYGYLAITIGGTGDLQSKAGLTLLKTHLPGRNVILIPDADKVGQEAMGVVSKTLEGVAASLKLVDIGTAWDTLFEGKKALPKGADISDLIETYQRCFPQSVKEDVRTIINSLIENADVTSKPTQNNFNDSILSLDELLKMYIPERRKMLHWMPEGSLIMIYGPRGIGKTYLTLELIKSLACGSPFLKWKVSNPAGCLLVDGEMPLHDIRQRFTDLLNEKTKAPVYFLSHEYFYTKTEKDLNLASIDIQYALQRFVETHPDIKMIVFDNLSCLLPGIREDKRDDWTLQVLPFLLWLRRRGIAVVLLHHSGKGGDQRGTSSREDALDTVIKLDRTPIAGAEGAEFIIRFTKARGAYGDEVADIEAKLTLIDGVSTWTWKPVKESTEERLLALIAEGIDSVTDAADELGITKGLVSRIKKKLQNEGTLLPGKELNLNTQSKGK